MDIDDKANSTTISLFNLKGQKRMLLALLSKLFWHQMNLWCWPFSQELSLFYHSQSFILYCMSKEIGDYRLDC